MNKFTEVSHPFFLTQVMCLQKFNNKDSSINFLKVTNNPEHGVILRGDGEGSPLKVKLRTDLIEAFYSGLQ